MNDLPESLTADISLWLAGESVGAEADRAVARLASDPSARRLAGDSLAIEDLVRDWYGEIPLPPPAAYVIERQRRRSLAAAAVSAVATGVLVATLVATVPFARGLEATSGWITGGLRPPVASLSWWQLRRNESAVGSADAGFVGGGWPPSR
jgi:hypothetical protein